MPTAPARPCRRRRRLLHRAGRRRRRGPRAGRRRLAGAGRRALLPGDRPRADGPRPPPPLRHPRPHAARHRGRAVRRRPPPPSATARRRRRPQRRASPATAPSSPPSRRAAPAASPTSSPPSRASRTRSSAPSCPASSSCRAARAPARRSSPSTAPPTSSTRTGSRSRARACSSSGPNRLFLGYIEQVLPSLGEAGVELAVLADLLTDAADDPRLRHAGHRPHQGRPPHGRRCSPRPSATGGARCATTSRSATASQILRVTAEQHPADRRRRPPAGPHPQRRPQVRRGRACSRRWPRAPGSRSSPARSRDRLRHDPTVREALERMWPVLTPAQLLHDLFGSKPLLRLAGGDRADRRRGRRPPPARGATPSTTSPSPTTTSRCSTRPGALLGPGPAAGSTAATATTTTTRCAPTATSSSTRRRTCRRCSCGCSAAARSTAR